MLIIVKTRYDKKIIHIFAQNRFIMKQQFANTLKITALLAILLVITSCDRNKTLVPVIPEDILPQAIYEQVTDYIPVYSGENPPEINGEYISTPHALIYQSDNNDNSIQYFSDLYLGFIYNKKKLDYYSKQYNTEAGIFEEYVQHDLKLTGKSDCFTCYYVIEDYPDGYYAKQSFIFSGKISDKGIEDFHTAVILLETSGHPNLPKKNTFRVLKDYDGLAEAKNWLSKRDNEGTKSSNADLFRMWMN